MEQVPRQDQGDQEMDRVVVKVRLVEKEPALKLVEGRVAVNLLSTGGIDECLS